MAKDPAVLFYTSDFIVGTMTMTDDQIGKYIKLLCLQHQQNGQLSEDDMSKICKSYDKDIYSKFKQHEDGFYYNERMLTEINKRSNYSNSRKINRLGGKTSKKTKLHDKDVSDISLTHDEDMLTHVRHMENENTTIVLDNKGSNKVNNDNCSSGTHMSDISLTHDEDMSKSKKNDKKVDYYKINNASRDYPHPIPVCMWNYFNNSDFQQTRHSHLLVLNLDANPAEAEKKLILWAEAFNRSLVNSNKLESTMGSQSESWIRHFLNWCRVIIQKRGYIDPSAIDTASDIKTPNSNFDKKKEIQEQIKSEPDKKKRAEMQLKELSAKPLK